MRRHKADGSTTDLATGLPGINSIALTRDGKRLFAGQVFMGEGLWEIDLAGVAPPRLVTDDTGGLNAFHFGPDGMIYAPSWERGQVVRVDPESGATTVLADGFQASRARSGSTRPTSSTCSTTRAVSFGRSTTTATSGASASSPGTPPRPTTWRWAPTG